MARIVLAVFGTLLSGLNPIDCALLCPHVLNTLVHGSIRACWKASQKSVWKAFWGNCKNEHLKNHKARCFKLMERSVYPVLAFRVSRWPPQTVIAQEVDRTQASMIASICRLSPEPGEEEAAFHRRRMKSAHAIARNNGVWSKRWFTRFEQWNEHLDRHPNHPTARLIKTRDDAWLQGRRSLYAATNPVRWNSWTSLAGRTGTRISSGYVAQRWQSGRDFGKQHL